MHFWVSAARAGEYGGCFRAEEIGHELVHARVGEKEVGRGGQQAGRRHDGVLLLAEKIEERLADFGGGHWVGPKQ